MDQWGSLEGGKRENASEIVQWHAYCTVFTYMHLLSYHGAPKVP